VGRLNLAGLDRVLIAVATGEKRILLRQYAIRLKRSGTKVPRASLSEMGPRLDFALRRCKPAPADLEAEALKQPAGLKKKKARRPAARCGAPAARTAAAAHTAAHTAADDHRRRRRRCHAARAPVHGEWGVGKARLYAIPR
jgi:hypothetical protein